MSDRQVRSVQDDLFTKHDETGRADNPYMSAAPETRWAFKCLFGMTVIMVNQSELGHCSSTWCVSMVGIAGSEK